jgi:hypothetical protein
VPGHNPLVGLVPSVRPNPATNTGSGAVSQTDFSVGPVHFTAIGLVLTAVIGLVLLHRFGFRFAVTVGRG